MSDPVGGNVHKIRRRRSRRHRRNRSIRRWLSLVTLATCVAAASAVALQYLSPSLFRARQSAVPSFEQAELSRSRVVEMNEILSQAQPSADRPVYPYSLVPGGVQDAKELKWVAEHDPVVAAHYAGFDYDHARVVRLTLARTVYLSYRIGNHVYWTRHRVALHKGEKLITDGRMTARGRCANRVEEMPQQATSRAEPPAEKFDQPIAPIGGTAMQSPPAPFQSALLQQPAGSRPGARRTVGFVRSICRWKLDSHRSAAARVFAVWPGQEKRCCRGRLLCRRTEHPKEKRRPLWLSRGCPRTGDLDHVRVWIGRRLLGAPQAPRLISRGSNF